MCSSPPQFPRLCSGRAGRPRALQDWCAFPRPSALGPSAHAWTHGHSWGCSSPSQGFELGTLAGPAFARLRRSLGLAEEDYQASLGPGGPYLQFLSTSKSKASFFLS